MSDEIVWQIINQSYCSFKIKTRTSNFCRNEYNVTGFCNRQSCPLANQRYATIRSEGPKGVLYLYMKTAERAHLPSKLYERIKLSSNYAEALKQIDSRLQFWPKFLIHKCKQRLTRLVQVAMRTRKLAAEEERLGERLVPKLAPKIRHREATRERKAEVAAKLERSIERELIERLRQGAYGDQPLNVSQSVWEKVLRGLEREGAAVRDTDMDEGIDEDEEEEAEVEEELEEEGAEKTDGVVEYVSESDFDESDEELADIEDWLGSEEDDDEEEDDEEEEDSEEETTKRKAKVGDKRKRARVIRSKGRKRKEIETEEESRQKLLAF